MGQSDADKAAHWDYATQWSLPKIETFGIIVPGLFGYRMDTPDGGAYWGAVGRNPGWDRYFASGEKGSPPPAPLRFYGTGNYAGTLVLLVALWAIAQSLRRKDSVFSTTHRQFLWFWTAVLLVSVLLAFGRFAPFYALLYKLPVFFDDPKSGQISLCIFVGPGHRFRLWHPRAEPALSGNSRHGFRLTPWATQGVVDKNPRLRPKLDFDLPCGFHRQSAGMVDLCAAKAEPGRLFENGGIFR